MMASVDMDMGDLFAERDQQQMDEDIAMPSLPDLDVPELTQVDPSQNEADADVVAKLRDKSKGASKRTVKPQPKLDPARLRGERGLAVLPKVFEKVKFKGKGHEKEDLNMLMGKLQHWGHRLFPKLQFDDLLERMEKLGSKKEVQNCVKRIRLDMPVLDDDFTNQDGDQIEDQDEGQGQTQPQDDEVDVDAMFDELMQQENELRLDDDQPSPWQQPAVTSSQEEPLDDNASRGKQNDSVPQAGSSLNENGQLPQSQTPAKSPMKCVDEAQKERMERNRRLALEKRAKRMGITLEELEKRMNPQGQRSTPSKSAESAQAVQVTAGRENDDREENNDEASASAASNSDEQETDKSVSAAAKSSGGDDSTSVKQDEDAEHSAAATSDDVKSDISCENTTNAEKMESDVNEQRETENKPSASPSKCLDDATDAVCDDNKLVADEEQQTMDEVMDALDSDAEVAAADSVGDGPVTDSSCKKTKTDVDSTETADIPVVDSTETADIPVVDGTETADVPVVDSRETADIPVVDSTETVDIPVVDSTETVDIPVVDGTKTVDIPVVDGTDNSDVPTKDTTDADDTVNPESNNQNTIPDAESGEPMDVDTNSPS